MADIMTEHLKKTTCEMKSRKEPEVASWEQRIIY